MIYKFAKILVNKNAIKPNYSPKWGKFEMKEILWGFLPFLLGILVKILLQHWLAPAHDVNKPNTSTSTIKTLFFVSECDDTDRDVSCLITPVTRTFVQYSMLLRI